MGEKLCPWPSVRSPTPPLCFCRRIERRTCAQCPLVTRVQITACSRDLQKCVCVYVIVSLFRWAILKRKFGLTHRSYRPRGSQRLLPPPTSPARLPWQELSRCLWSPGTARRCNRRRTINGERDIPTWMTVESPPLQWSERHLTQRLLAASRPGGKGRILQSSPFQDPPTQLIMLGPNIQQLQWNDHRKWRPWHPPCEAVGRCKRQTWERSWSLDSGRSRSRLIAPSGCFVLSAFYTSIGGFWKDTKIKKCYQISIADAWNHFMLLPQLPRRWDGHSGQEWSATPVGHSFCKPAIAST